MRIKYYENNSSIKFLDYNKTISTIQSFFLVNNDKGILEKNMHL